MKTPIYFLVLFINFGYFNSANAQSDKSQLIDYKSRHAIYDYGDKVLSNRDSVPDYQQMEQPLKISGTVYHSDGISPAKDVILFIEQPNDNGDFELGLDLDKRFVKHRAWVKTDADGHYEFDTFIPGRDRHSTELKSIQLAIMEPQQKEIITDSFLFENDKYLRKSCRKKLEAEENNKILKLNLKDGYYLSTRNFILKESLKNLAKK